MATTYTGYFNSIHDKTYKVQITVNKGNATKSITLGGDPFITTQEGSSETLYAPIKSSGASIQILQYGLDYIEDFYAANAHHAKVELFGPNNVLAWRGWVQPCIYDQSWVTQTEVLEVTANASLSTLEYYKWDGETRMSFKDIINSILIKAQGVDYFCFPTNMKINGDECLLDELFISTKNFCGEDKDDNWTLKEVLSEICQYLSVSAVEDYDSDGCTVYFLDYDAIKNNWNSYYRYKVGSGAMDYKTKSSRVVIDQDSYMSANTNLSLDTVFNKVTVSTSLNTVEGDLSTIGDSDRMTPVSNSTSSDTFLPETLALETSGNTVASPLELEAWYNGVQWIYDKEYKKMLWTKFYDNQNFEIEQGWTVTNEDVNLWGSASAGQRVDLSSKQDYESAMNTIGAWIIKQDAQAATEGGKSNFFARISNVSMKDYLLLTAHRGGQYSVDNNKDHVTALGVPGVQGNYYHLERNRARASTEALEPTQKLCTWKGVFNAPTSTNTQLVVNFKSTYLPRRITLYKTDSDDIFNEAASDGWKTEKYLDFIWVQIKVGEYYVTGPYTTPGGIKYGYIGWNYDRNEPSDSLGSESYTFSTTPGLMRLYYNMSEKWIGNTLNLNSNIEWKDGIEATEGIAINLDVDNAFIDGVQTNPYTKFGDQIEISFFRPHPLSEYYFGGVNSVTSHLFGGVLISDFKVSVERRNLDNIAKDKDDTETVYTIDIDEGYSIKGPEQSNKITTYDGKAMSYSDVVDADGRYIDEVTNNAIPGIDAIPGNKTRLEWWSCWRMKKQYQEPRVVLTLDIKDDGVKPYSTFTNMGKTFIADSIGHDYRYDTVNLKIIEKA